MIIIDFLIDEDELAENLDNEIAALDYDLYVITIFIMPVRIKINTHDLFECNGDPWTTMPIMNIASNGLLMVKDLKDSGKENFDLPEGAGDIEFTMLDEVNVKVSYIGFAKPFVTTVTYAELLEAFQKFADKVRKFMWERVPQLNDHPYWGPWLRGERD